MLLAIDVGNSHTVYGVWNGEAWVQTWRRVTDIETTEDEITAWLRTMFEIAGIEFRIDCALCASVVPGIDQELSRLCRRFFGVELRFLTAVSQSVVHIEYSPPTSVGADRIANAIGALAEAKPPIVVVDFGTATTFDVIDSRGVYIGGAILPGPATSLQALVSRTAKLPAIELIAPETAIGKTTPHAIQSGLMFGYAGAIDALIARISGELGTQPTVFSTGGLGAYFERLCQGIDTHRPMLTLDGLRLALQDG